MTHTVTLNHWISGGGTASMAGHAMTTVSPSITSTLLFPESITDGGTAKLRVVATVRRRLNRDNYTSLDIQPTA